MSANPPKLLVTAAWEPELTRFRARLAAAPVSGLEVVLATLGVGLVESAAAMTLCVARHSPSAALLLGTCGTFAGASAVGSVVAAAGVHLADASLVDGVSALPDPMPGAAALDRDLHDAVVAAGATSVQVANTLGITTDDALAAKLAAAARSLAAGSEAVEHLEAFGFARAAARAGVPCAVVLGVANVVGAQGRAQWLARHVSASASAADLAFAALPALEASLRARLGVRT